MQTKYKDFVSLISSETNIQLLLFVLKTELLDTDVNFPVMV